MKPVYAHRETTCHQCQQTIEKGSERLDDMVRFDERVVRFHYHKECFIQKVETFFRNSAYEPERRAGAGPKPRLDLTTEQYKYRHQLLARLSSLKSYYTPRLNFKKPPEKLTESELIRFHNFFSRRKAILDELGKVGGIPDTHLHSVADAEYSQNGEQLSAFLTLQQFCMDKS